MIIRIWNGCRVVHVISVGQEGGSSTLGAVGGAGNSTNAEIEIDPWAGLIVDHRDGYGKGPVAWRDYEKDMDDAYARGRAHGE